MSDKHTQGRLRLEQVEDDSGHITHLCPVDAEDMSILTVVEHESVKFAAVYHSEDARRLVACWNACEGIRTEALEHRSHMLKAGDDQITMLTAQRDELLAALHLLVAGIENNVSPTFIPLQMARAAIAKAEAK